MYYMKSARYKGNGWVNPTAPHAHRQEAGRERDTVGIKEKLYLDAAWYVYWVFKVQKR